MPMLEIIKGFKKQTDAIDSITPENLPAYMDFL